MEIPQKKERSPWAIVSILLVVFLFGLFWWWQQRQLPDDSFQQEPATQMRAQESVDTSLDLSLLEASAVNIAIPAFETLF